MKTLTTIALCASLLSSCTNSYPYYADSYYPRPSPAGNRYLQGYSGGSYRAPQPMDSPSSTGFADIAVPLAIGAGLIWAMGGGSSESSGSTDASSSPEAYEKANQNAESMGRPAPYPEYR
ncbi:MAG: hypothetical protein JNJ83_17185 [Verrucomicrobiaceae bacterium]|nr:hypothetical protein [Verrucomicrobiaceae bacterium]